MAASALPFAPLTNKGLRSNYNRQARLCALALAHDGDVEGARRHAQQSEDFYQAMAGRMAAEIELNRSVDR